MKEMFFLLALIALALGLGACTIAKYEDCYYLSVLEKKSLSLSQTSDTLTLTFSKDSDQAVDAFKQGLTTAASLVSASSK